MVCLFSVNIHAVPLSNVEYVKYSSLLNTLKGNCFDDEQYCIVRTAVVRKPGLGLGLGLVSFVLGLGLVVMVLVLRIWSCSDH